MKPTLRTQAPFVAALAVAWAAVGIWLAFERAETEALRAATRAKAEAVGDELALALGHRLSNLTRLHDHWTTIGAKHHATEHRAGDHHAGDHHAHDHHQDEQHSADQRAAARHDHEEKDVEALLADYLDLEAIGLVRGPDTRVWTREIDRPEAGDLVRSCSMGLPRSGVRPPPGSAFFVSGGTSARRCIVVDSEGDAGPDGGTLVAVWSPVRMASTTVNVTGYDLEVRLEEMGLISSSSPAREERASTSVSYVRALHGENWTLGLTPTEATIAGARSALPYVSLLCGLLCAALIGFLLRLYFLAGDAQASLRSSEQRLKELMRLAPVGIFIATPEGECEFVNGSWTALTGLPLEEALGHGWRKAVHPDDGEEFAADWRRLLSRRETFSREHRYIHTSGELRWVVTRITHAGDGGGVLLGAVQDITSLKLAEREAGAYREAMDRAEAVAMIDRDGRLTQVNDNLCSVTGRDRAYLVGRAFCELFEPEEGDAAQPSAPSRGAIAEALRRGETWKGVARATTSAGGTAWVDTTLVPMLAPDGSVGGFISLQRDVTVRKRQEAALDSALRKAEAATEAKSQFLANMSHEIRTPMNGVLGMVGLLLDTPLSDKQRELAQVIRDCGESLLAIVNDVLDISKIEAGKVELEILPFELARCLEQSIFLLDHKASRKKLQVVTRIDPDVPRFVASDAGRLRQILINLVGNAIKFTEQGGVTVHVSLSREPNRADDGRVELRFDVSDTGIGLEPEKVARLFRSFSQGDSSTTRRFGGTGLGLAICRSFVEMLGGRIWVESLPGKGSTFSFTLRVGRAIEASKGDDLGDGASQAEVFARPERALRILVAEDNSVNARLTVALLEKLGHESKVVVNGLEAVEAVIAEAFDVVLMDVQMPELSGLEASVRIRAMGASVHQPVIVALTANVMESAKRECKDAGMDGYVSKPVRVGDLDREIRACVAVANPPTSTLGGPGLLALASSGPSGARPGRAPGGATMSVGAVNPVIRGVVGLVGRDTGTTGAAGAAGAGSVPAARPFESPFAPVIELNFGGDPEVFVEVVDVFLARAGDLLQALEAAVGGDDLPAREKAAHKLKGAVSLFGRRALEKDLAALEMEAREGKETRARETLASVVEACEELCRALEADVAARRKEAA